MASASGPLLTLPQLPPLGSPEPGALLASGTGLRSAGSAGLHLSLSIQVNLELHPPHLESLLKAVGVGGVLLDTKAYAEELRRELSGELDYRRERAQLEHYRELLARWVNVVVPRPWPALCTGRVLTLELLEGPTLAELAQGTETLTAEERLRRGEQLRRAVCGPWILHRIIHADPHPGNYVALPDGRLGVLDFGSVKAGSETFWRCTLEGVRAILEGAEADWAALHRRLRAAARALRLRGGHHAGAVGPVEAALPAGSAAHPPAR